MPQKTVALIIIAFGLLVISPLALPLNTERNFIVKATDNPYRYYLWYASSWHLAEFRVLNLDFVGRIGPALAILYIDGEAQFMLLNYKGEPISWICSQDILSLLIGNYVVFQIRKG
jgi:hypothetical protein